MAALPSPDNQGDRIRGAIAVLATAIAEEIWARLIAKVDEETSRLRESEEKLVVDGAEVGA